MPGWAFLVVQFVLAFGLSYAAARYGSRRLQRAIKNEQQAAAITAQQEYITALERQLEAQNRLIETHRHGAFTAAGLIRALRERLSYWESPAVTTKPRKADAPN